MKISEIYIYDKDCSKKGLFEIRENVLNRRKYYTDNELYG